MDQEIVLALVGIGSASLSSILTWVFNKKKENANINNTIISGMQESLEFYEKLSDDTKKRLEEAMDERVQLSNKIDEQSKKLANLETELLKLSVSICYKLSCKLRQTEENETNQ